MATEVFQGLNYCCLGFFLLKCDMIRSCNSEEQQRETEALENVDEHVTERARFTSLPRPRWFPGIVYKWSFGILLCSCHWLSIKSLKMQNSLKYYSKPFKWYSTSHNNIIHIHLLLPALAERRWTCIMLLQLFNRKCLELTKQIGGF